MGQGDRYRKTVVANISSILHCQSIKREMRAVGSYAGIWGKGLNAKKVELSRGIDFTARAYSN
ncbi:hypothetical protein ACLOJK_033344 [Asimina triloba]